MFYVFDQKNVHFLCQLWWLQTERDFELRRAHFFSLEPLQVITIEFKPLPGFKQPLAHYQGLLESLKPFLNFQKGSQAKSPKRHFRLWFLPQASTWSRAFELKSEPVPAPSGIIVWPFQFIFRGLFWIRGFSLTFGCPSQQQICHIRGYTKKANDGDISWYSNISKELLLGNNRLSIACLDST